MEFWAQAAWAIAPAIIVGVFMAWWNRRQRQEDEEKGRRDEERIKIVTTQLSLAVASAQLAYAVAMAYKRGAPNGEMETALKFAAERGVDVKLILPGVPDKIAPYALAKTHYASLLSSGVKIYEYTPGFVHAKVFISDGREGVVGTINLDYRSLYHHFECAAWMYGVPCLADMEQDFQATLEKCRAVTLETIKKEKWTLKVMGWLFKAVAPLM